MTIFFDKESRSLGEEDHAAKKEEGVGELDGDGDAVRACVVTLSCGIVYDGCE